MVSQGAHDTLSRRDAIRALTMLSGGVLAGCFNRDTLPPYETTPVLSARPAAPSQQGTAGKTRFDLWNVSGVAYAPSNVQSPAPLLLFLHGAGRVAEPFLDGWAAAADAAGVILLAPYSFASTWDAIGGAFGLDIGGINASLHWVFDRWQVDPARIACCGFSDGATYSLAVGRANGDLFARVIAFSPGFLIPVEQRQLPPILITHGTLDTVLPIERTSRVIVPALRGQGYAVDYREFEGGHAVPQGVANEVIAALGA